LYKKEPNIVVSLFFTIIKRVANDLLRNVLNGGLSFLINYERRVRVVATRRSVVVVKKKKNLSRREEVTSLFAFFALSTALAELTQ